jgi:hypothetical protein
MKIIDISFPSYDDGKLSLRPQRLTDYLSNEYNNSQAASGALQKQFSSTTLIKKKSEDTLGNKSSKERIGSNIKIIEELKNSDETSINLKLEAFMKTEKSD